MGSGFRRIWDEWADEILSRGDPLLALVLLWAVRQATWKEARIMRYGQEVVLRPGQFLFGEHRAADELGISRHQFRRRMSALQTHRILHIRTHNRFSVGTIEKWEFRAGDETGDAHQNAQETHRKRTPFIESRFVDFIDKKPQLQERKPVEGVEKEKSGGANPTPISGSDPWDEQPSPRLFEKAGSGSSLAEIQEAFKAAGIVYRGLDLSPLVDLIHKGVSLEKVQLAVSSIPGSTSAEKDPVAWITARFLDRTSTGKERGQRKLEKI